MQVHDGSISYSVVAVVRNEIGTISKTLECIADQTVKPTHVVVVDDGSNDGTSAVLDSFARQHSFMEIMHFPDKGYMDYESAHVKLKSAVKRVLEHPNDFIVKLDMDITFASTYFEEIFHEFAADSQLGIAGGWFFVLNGDVPVPEECPVFHVRGGSKVYRKQCWDAIGGFVPRLGYDMIDEVQANMHGWKTKSFRGIQVIHHRKTGGTKGPVRWRRYAGKLGYIVWYSPVYMVAKSIKLAITARPFGIVGLALLRGFLECYWRHTPRSIQDPAFKKYIRQQQVRKLLGLSTIWR